MKESLPNTNGDTLTGVLTRIRFQSGGFLIAGLHTGDTVVGDMLEPVEGLEYEFRGRWEENEKFGPQYRFNAYSACLPKSNDGIIRYLVRVAKWVKMTRAKQITDLYRADTLDVLKADPERVVRDIKGITLPRALEIQDFLVKNEAFERAIVEIEQIISRVKGLPRRLASDLLKRYKSDAPTVLRNDPYVLTNFAGVGFRLADSVALLNDFPKASPARQAAAIVHVLKEAGSKYGHTIMGLTETMMQADHLIGVPATGGLPLAALRKDIDFPGGRSLALTKISDDERAIAGIVRTLMETPLPMEITVSTAGLEEDQIAAMEVLRKNRFSILTGPPGSGKTYAFARFVPALIKAGYKRIAYCAPTGKAAQRMTESLQDTVPGAQAYTIHKILGPQMDEKTGEFEFRHGPSDPIPYDALITDETSMLSTDLAADLLRATTNEMLVLFVGDPDQLPSIGPGAVLKDLMESGVPTARLDTIKRNAGQIVRACHKIRRGERFAWSPSVDLDAGENLRHIRKKEPKDIIKSIVKIAVEKVPALGLDPFWDFQALSPMNTRSQVSCDALNEELAEALNPQAKPIKGLDFTVGDKVVRIRNAVVPGMNKDSIDPMRDLVRDADQMEPVIIVNGDQGQVLAVNKGPDGKQRIIVHLRNPDRIVYLPRSDHSLRRSYCVTVHRMQGSDAPVIVIPLHKSLGSFPTREMIYTAISRAKTLCITVGDSNIAYDMIRRVSAKRKTLLVERVKGLV